MKISFPSRSLRLALAGLIFSIASFAQDPKPTPAPEPAPAPTPAPAPAPAPTPAPEPSPATTTEKKDPAAETTPAPATKPAESATFARLICYREKKFAGMALHHTVHLDGEEVGNLNNGTFFILKVTPGEHKLHADEKKDEFSFKVEAGKTYYFKTEIQMGFWKGHGRISAVEASFGEKEFTEMKGKGKLQYTPDVQKADLHEKP